jgi:hypothetical protein
MTTTNRELKTEVLEGRNEGQTPNRVKANHHEKFRLFHTLGGNYAEVERFLNTNNVNPKSLSISKIEGNNSLVSIGYEETLSQHQFHLVTRTFPGGGSTNLEATQRSIEDAAAQLTGIICQDVVYADGQYIVTFLTTK